MNILVRVVTFSTRKYLETIFFQFSIVYETINYFCLAFVVASNFRGDLNDRRFLFPSGLPIDADIFRLFCDTVAPKYVDNYSWYHMTVTMHKILIHGWQIMRHSIIRLSSDAVARLHRYCRALQMRQPRDCCDSTPRQSQFSIATVAISRVNRKLFWPSWSHLLQDLSRLLPPFDRLTCCQIAVCPLLCSGIGVRSR